MQNEIRYGSCQGQLRISNSIIFPFGGILVLLVWELVNFDNNADTCYLKHKIKRRYDLQDTHEMSKERSRVVGFHPSDGDAVLLSYVNYVYEHNLLTSRSKKIGDFPVEAMKFHRVFRLCILFGQPKFRYSHRFKYFHS